MHPEAQELFRKFLSKYYPKEDLEGKIPEILDVGSYNVNGSLKDLLQEFLGILVTARTPEACKTKARKLKYVGLDQAKGPNVDVVGDAHRMPFEPERFDIIISSSCFEHDEMFWVTFAEMARVLKTGGLLYICVPSSGPYHGFPGDCWRFYADSWKSLAKWCPSLELIEASIDTTGVWKDTVGIFRKK